MDSPSYSSEVTRNMAALALLLPPPHPDPERYSVQSPPPLPDSGGDRFDWDDLAERTGWRYPADFRCFAETYGAGGEIARSIAYNTPPPAGVEFRVDRREKFPPEDGLRQWGGDDVADDFFWRCADPDPDKWTVAIHTRDRDKNGERWHDYPMGVVEFLVGLLGGTLEVPLGIAVQPGVQSFKGWREQDLAVRAAYPDFDGMWTMPVMPDRWYDA